MIKAIVFDFDGVIVDSNRLKYDAWFDIFNDSDEVTEELIKEAIEKIKQSRFDILRYIFQKLNKKQEDIEKLVSLYTKKYDDIVQNGIFKIGLPDYIKNTLGKLAEKYVLFINSATPKDALEESVKALGIDKIFKGAYGFKESKLKNLEKIRDNENIESREIVFVGDGEGDFSTAKECGCFFIGIANEFNGWGRESFPTTSDFSELPSLISLLKL